MLPKHLFAKKNDQYKNNLNMLVADQVSCNKKILDVGCSEGALGKFLRREKSAKVVGIDISKEAIKAARNNLDDAFVIDIECEQLPFRKNKFDIIICADVLEHLYDPLAVLRKLKHCLIKDGIFILSIPNVAYIGLRVKLLLGNFDYQEAGIMDSSHIRFFTKRAVDELVCKAGLRIIKIDYTPGFSFIFLQGRILRIKFFDRLKYWLNRLAPRLFCSQFIIVAKKI